MAKFTCVCRIWDLLTGKCIRVLEGHSGRVNAVAVCNERSTALTASDDSTARVWDMETGRCLAVLEVSAPVLEALTCVPVYKRQSSADLSFLSDML